MNFPTKFMQNEKQRNVAWTWKLAERSNSNQLTRDSSNEWNNWSMHRFSYQSKLIALKQCALSESEVNYLNRNLLLGWKCNWLGQEIWRRQYECSWSSLTVGLAIDPIEHHRHKVQLQRSWARILRWRRQWMPGNVPRTFAAKLINLRTCFDLDFPSVPRRSRASVFIHLPGTDDIQSKSARLRMEWHKRLGLRWVWRFLRGIKSSVFRQSNCSVEYQREPEEFHRNHRHGNRCWIRWN